MERPRQKGHGDYATNVALQLAKKAGTNPRALRRAARRRAARRPTASRRSRSPGRASSTSPSRPGAQGEVAADDRRGGRGATAARRARRPDDQRRVHLGQPDRPAAPGPHPVGRARRRDRPGARGRRRRGDPRVLHQRPRRPDGPLRRVARGRRAGPAGARGRLPRAPTSHDLAAQVVAERPRHPRPARRRAAGGVPRGRLRAAARGAAGAARRVRHPLRRLVLRARPLHESRRGRRARSQRPARTRATSSRPTARCGCAPPTSATTRTGC